MCAEMFVFGHHRSCYGALVLSLVVPLGRSMAETPELTERFRFAKCLAVVSLQSEPRDVTRIVGLPDKIVAREDGGQVWHYGCAGRTEFPTLGRVEFRRQRGKLQVVAVVGAFRGDVSSGINKDLPKETTLRSIVALLAEPMDCGDKYYPRAMICIVNAMQPIGKDGALATLQEYLRLTSESESFEANVRVSLILRCLFVVPTGVTVRRLDYGSLSPETVPDPRHSPIYPLHIIHDVPFLLARGFGLEGPSPTCKEDLTFYATNGRIRQQPLIPKDPTQALRALMKSSAWADIDRDDADRFAIALQYLSLVRPDLSEDAAWNAAASAIRDDGWLDRITALHPTLQWDAKSQSYRVRATK